MYILDDLYLISSEILTNFQGLAEYINIKLYLSIMKVASPKIIKRDNFRTHNKLEVVY